MQSRKKIPIPSLTAERKRVCVGAMRWQYGWLGRNASSLIPASSVGTMAVDGYRGYIYDLTVLFPRFDVGYGGGIK